MSKRVRIETPSERRRQAEADAMWFRIFGPVIAIISFLYTANIIGPR